MLKKKALFLALMGSLLSAGAQAINAAAAIAEPPPTDQLIVKYRDLTRSDGSLGASDLNVLRSLTQAAGFGARYYRQTGGGGHVLKLDRAASLAAVRSIAAAIVAADPNVEYAEPDAIARPFQSIPNDPDWYMQWPLYDPIGGINATSAWAYSTGAGVVVGVVDSGHRPHPELLANGYNGYDFVSNSTNARDGDGWDSNALDPGDWRIAGQCAAPLDQAGNSTWHGTHVAGIIGAQWNNSSGISGVAPNAKLLSVRVMGSCGGYTSDIADGITWASGGTVPGTPANSMPANVVNLSLGGNSGCPAAIQGSINGARGRGAVVIGAAGNDNMNVSGVWPGNCAGVVVVAATDITGAKYSWSNTGSAVALAAPGVNVWSTYNSGTTTAGADNFSLLTGTSMAAPHVSGAVALMRSVNPTLLPDDVGIILKGTTRAFPTSCSGCGSGILNAGAALNAVRPGALKGTFATSYGNRTGTTSFVAITNAGSGWITGITASCSQSGAYITVQPPSALGPGQSMTIQAAVNSGSGYLCGYVVQGKNATSAPHSVSTF